MCNTTSSPHPASKSPVWRRHKPDCTHPGTLGRRQSQPNLHLSESDSLPSGLPRSDSPLPGSPRLGAQRLDSTRRGQTHSGLPHTNSHKPDPRRSGQLLLGSGRSGSDKAGSHDPCQPLPGHLRSSPPQTDAIIHTHPTRPESPSSCPRQSASLQPPAGCFHPQRPSPRRRRW